MTAESITRCSLTDIDVTGCAHCRAVKDTVRWFYAAYEGTCTHPACGQPIAVGERIHEAQDGTYEHARCAKRSR